MIEVWKDIEGYVGLYKISNLGRVLSFQHKPEGRVLKPGTRSEALPYKSVVLCKKRKKKFISIHRLVAKAFLNNKYNKPFVNHIDNNPTNNKLNNLEWCTPLENTLHATKQNRMAWGARNGNCKLSEETVIHIRRLYNVERHSLLKISSLTGVSKANVLKICNRKLWSNLPEENIEAFLKRRAEVSANPRRSKLKHSTIVKVREMWGSGVYTQIKIAKLLDIPKSTIHNICSRKHWKEI